MIRGPAACAAGPFIPCRGGHCPPAKAGTHSPDGGRTMCAPTRPPETRCLHVRPQRPGRIHRTAGAQCAPLPAPRKRDASMSARKGRDAFTGRLAHNVRPCLSPGNRTPPYPPPQAGTHPRDGGRTMCAPTRPPETRCLLVRPQRPGRIHRTAGAQCPPLPAPGNAMPPYPPWRNEQPPPRFAGRGPSHFPSRK